MLIEDEELGRLRAALGDLVLAKKTQRDKDWPMIRRLVEQSYFTRSDAPATELVRLLVTRIANT